MEMLKKGIGWAIWSYFRPKRKQDNPKSPMFKEPLPYPRRVERGYWVDGNGCVRRNHPKRNMDMSPRQWKRHTTARRRAAKATA